MKALLAKAAGKSAQPAQEKNSPTSSMAALVAMAKVEQSGAKRLELAQGRLVAAVESALSQVLTCVTEADDKVKVKVRATFDTLTNVSRTTMSEIVDEEEKAHREKMSSQSALLEARLETMRKASQMQLKQQEVKMAAERETALRQQRNQMLEGGDGYARRLVEQVEQLQSQLAHETGQREAIEAMRTAELAASTKRIATLEERLRELEAASEAAAASESERAALAAQVSELQQGLAELSVKVDTVKGENTQLRDENVVLKDYLNNLMAKVGTMSKLGTTAPSRAMVGNNPDGAQSVLVNDHIGELTAPAMDD